MFITIKFNTIYWYLLMSFLKLSTHVFSLIICNECNKLIKINNMCQLLLFSCIKYYLSALFRK